MITPLDEYVFDLPPEIRTPGIYVDDGPVYAVGRRGTVEDIPMKAARRLFKAFEDGAGLPVSKTKGRVKASCTKLAKARAQRLRKMGCKSTKVMAILGIDTAARRGDLHGHQRVRLGAMQKRAVRLRRPKGVGADISHVAQAAVVPGVAQGARVTGMTPAVLRSLRRTMAIGLPDRAKQASTTLQYMTAAKVIRDQAYAACGAPLRFWSRQAFKDQDETSLVLQQAWVKQAPKLGGAALRPCQKSGKTGKSGHDGDAKLKWTASSAFHAQTAEGVTLDLRKVSPHTIDKLAKTSFEQTRREWANTPSSKSEAFKRGAQGCWMAEPRRMMRGKGKDWTAIEAACLGSIIGGSQ